MEAMMNPKETIQRILHPEELAPGKVSEGMNNSINAANRIIFGSRQNSIGEAFAADGYDAVIGLLPFVGDAIGNGSRAAIAKAANDDEAALVHGANFAIGLVPIVGDLIDVLIPGNAILYARKSGDCMKSGTRAMDCLFPDDAIEKQTMKMFSDMRE